MKRSPIWIAALVLALGLGGKAPGQGADAALKDRVNTLIERLGSPTKETADAAEAALIKLGDRVLPLLPEKAKDDKANADREQRLGRIREALAKAVEDVNLGASKVTIKGTAIRLSEVLQKLQSQTGNALTDLREAEGAEASNPALDVDIVDKPFLEALDIVCKQAEVSPNFYSGDGTIGIMAAAIPKDSVLIYNGPFRIELKQVAAVREIATGVSNASVQFEIGWEPRLRPMLLALKADELKIIDDRDKEIEPQVDQESTDVVLRPENPIADVNLRLKAPERAAKAIKIKANVTVPAGLKTFRFKSIDVKSPVKTKQDEVEITLEGTEVDEQVWKVNVVLGYPEGGAAFESYRQGLFNNRLWLQKADGSKFEHNGGFSNTSSGEGKLGFEYIFVDAPGSPADYGLVYETPSKVLTIPLEFELKDVNLP